MNRFYTLGYETFCKVTKQNTFSINNYPNRYQKIDIFNLYRFQNILIKIFPKCRSVRVNWPAV